MITQQQYKIDLAYSLVHEICEVLDARFAAMISADGPMPPPELSSQISALKDARHALAKIRTPTNAD